MKNRLYLISTARTHGDHEDGDQRRVVSAENILQAIEEVVAFYFEDDPESGKTEKWDLISGEQPREFHSHANFTIDLTSFGVKVEAQEVSAATAREQFEMAVEALYKDFAAARTRKPCESCNGQGWMVMNNDEHGLRIERCDTCYRFSDDEEAIKYVARLAKLVDL